MIKLILQSQIVKIFIVFFLSSLLLSLTTEVNDSYGIIEGGKGVILLVTFISTIVYAWIMGKSDAQLVITNHNSRFIFRGILLAFIPIILTIQSGNYSNLLLVYYAYSIFWLFFNVFYDIYRPGPYLIGTTSNIDKTIQWVNNKTFLGRYFPIWLFLFQGLLIASSVVLLIKYYV